MTQFLIPAGRRMAEVAWPAYEERRGGTCDFMTEKCRKHCVLKTNELERASFAFFEDNPVHAIKRQVLVEMEELEASVLCWFVGSGDCPSRHTQKMLQVVSGLSDVGVTQNGFTRNANFWFAANDLPDVCVVLTIEKGDEAKKREALRIIGYNRRNHRTHVPKIDRVLLVAEPNYRAQTVRIYRVGINATETGEKRITCGGGYVKEYRSALVEGARPPAKTTIEDCSLCLQEGRGCYALAPLEVKA